MTRAERPALFSAATSDLLEWIRALAAWAVVAGHLRALLFVGFGESETRSLPIRALYFATGFGHQAVMVFFVLSGLLIGSGLLEELSSGRFRWAEYGAKRLSRLWTSLLPALLLTALFDRVGAALLGLEGSFYGGDSHGAALGRFDWAAQTGIDTLLGNALFLQDIALPTFGTNGALWSLSHEFWFYVLGPLLLLALGSGNGLPLRARSAGLLLGLSWLLGEKTREGFTLWLMGLALAVALRRRMQLSGARGRILQAVGTALFSALMVISRLEPTGALAWLATDHAVAFGVVALLAGLLFGPAIPVAAPLARWGKSLAAFSFTLYLVHLPMLVCAQGLLLGRGPRWQPTPTHLLAAVAVGAGAGLFCWGVARLFEARTPAVRSWMLRLVGNQAGSARSPVR